jgi:hypothetical protein
MASRHDIPLWIQVISIMMRMTQVHDQHVAVQYFFLANGDNGKLKIH